jgi:hypothetical protein
MAVLPIRGDGQGEARPDPLGEHGVNAAGGNRTIAEQACVVNGGHADTVPSRRVSRCDSRLRDDELVNSSALAIAFPREGKRRRLFAPRQLKTQKNRHGYRAVLRTFSVLALPLALELRQVLDFLVGGAGFEPATLAV